MVLLQKQAYCTGGGASASKVFHRSGARPFRCWINGLRQAVQCTLLEEDRVCAGEGAPALRYYSVSAANRTTRAPAGEPQR